MPVYTYVRNQDSKSRVVKIDLEGGLELRIGTYANLTSSQLAEIYSSGVGVVLEEGIVPPASFAGGSQVFSVGTIVPPFAANTLYRQYQAVLNENKIYIAKAEFESGVSFKEENWTLITSSTQAKIQVWTKETGFTENELVVSPEGELLRTLKNFTSGKEYVF